MYWFMHILHGVRGYSLMGADYKLTIFNMPCRVGTFRADAQTADDGVHHDGVLFNIDQVKALS